MRNLVLNVPTFAFIVSTRAALAAGVGLLVAEKFPIARRRAIGAGLVAVGALTTIPAVMSLRRNLRKGNGSAVSQDKRLIGATRFPRRGDADFVSRL
jgi:hypothetical protein